MILKNREGLKKYNISKNWYKNRPNGISAFIRTKWDEKWIGACLESILPFFDEIVITIDCNDRSKEIINSFKSKKIKVFDYPFKLTPFGNNHDKCSKDSVHDFAYYTNWSISKTSYSHVCRWDSDMLMLPSMATKEIYNLFLKNNVTRFKGYDIVTPDFKYISKVHPFSGSEVRVYKVNKHLFFYQSSMMESLNYEGLLQLLYLDRWKKHFYPQIERLTNWLIRKDTEIKKPLFCHTNLLGGWKIKRAESEKNNAWYRNLETYIEKGDKININIPSFFFKKPEDYLRKKKVNKK